MVLTSLLAVVWKVNPVIFYIGKFPLRWYSLLFISGFILGYFIFKWYYKREGLSTNLLDPLLYALLIGTIVGARLGHCFFYEPQYFLAHPWEIFAVWKGGLASHGGAIGVLLAIWWYVAKYGKKNGFDMMWVLDRLVITICFAGAFIRLGNLMNSEIYGNPTNLPWGFIFALRGETVPKHPTQIYEALSYAILGFILLWMYRYKLQKIYKGLIFGLFLIGCFGMRFLIEYIKEPQEAFEATMHLNMGQILSIPFIAAGIVCIVLACVYKRPATLKDDASIAADIAASDARKSVASNVKQTPKKKAETHYAHSVEKD
jgi:phosphatidylglycerol:prolipoprotein diacylglycerol transferase